MHRTPDYDLSECHCIACDPAAWVPEPVTPSVEVKSGKEDEPSVLSVECDHCWWFPLECGGYVGASIVCDDWQADGFRSQ